MRAIETQPSHIARDDTARSQMYAASLLIERLLVVVEKVTKLRRRKVRYRRDIRSV